MTTPDALPRLILDKQPDELERFLSGIQQILLQNPGLVQSLIPLFIEEGRRFGQSEEGQRWQKTLSEAELVKKGRFVWDAYTMDAVLEARAGMLPTAWIDLLTAALATPDLESLLSTRLFDTLS